MALDRVNHRVFVPAYGNGGYRVFQLTKEGRPEERSAMYVIGRPTLYGRRGSPVPSDSQLGFPGAISIFDNSTQRLFALDRFNNRILVYRATPELARDSPAAYRVIGQPDFNSTLRGVGPNRFGLVSSAAIDEKGQRLFVVDGPNNRLLVFDIRADRLTDDPSALAVLGQTDFNSRSPGLGPGKLSRPGSAAYDPVFDRLFISDIGNNRVLIFDATPGKLVTGAAAAAVMGQPDFHSRRPRRSLDQLKPESLAYDWQHHRLFISEDLQHRIMVYEAHPDRMERSAKAIAVIGQSDFVHTHPAVSRNRLAMPRVAIDPSTQKLYVSEGFPAGNRISIWDIRPEKLHTGMAAQDLLGATTADGEPDFFNRMPQGKIDSRSLAGPRSLVLDRLDHRLFVADMFNHRVVVWQLDEQNRIADRSARWVLGQPDLNSSLMGPPSSSNMAVPLAINYDSTTKRLFVGDGYHNRILVYHAAPEALRNGLPASIVIGQPDFTTVESGAGRTHINFDIRMGRGIASDFIPMGLAIDEAEQQLFASDGENNRILVYDISPAELHNAPAAQAVLGQPDFQTNAPGAGKSGLHDPSYLALDSKRRRLFAIDSKNHRILIFDVDSRRLVNGMEATAELGQPDFTGTQGASELNSTALEAPNGIAYDEVRDLLYVTDGGGRHRGDRVLIFDVNPERLRNGAPAVAALGVKNAQVKRPRNYGGSLAFPGQFSMHDARDMTLDGPGGRLFVAESFPSRIMLFNFPRARWPYTVPPHQSRSYSTLDAADPGLTAQTATHRAVSIRAEQGRAAAMGIYTVTKAFVHKRTQRHSRIVVSETALAASAGVREAVFWIDGDPEIRHRISIYNPGSTEALVEISGRTPQGRTGKRVISSVSSGRLRVLFADELGLVSEGSGTLLLQSDHPIAVSALREQRNERNELLLSPVPFGSVKADRPVGESVIPILMNGAGYHTQLILVNDSDQEIRGHVFLYDADGHHNPLGGTSELLAYVLPPRGSQTFQTDGDGPRTLHGYAVVKANQGMLPRATVLVSNSMGRVQTSEALITASFTRRSSFVIDTRPTPIRHGDVEVEFILSNPGIRTASVSFTLNGVGDRVQNREIPRGGQVIVSAEELFGRNISGVVALQSDQELGMGLLQVTHNLRGESILTGFPSLAEGEGVIFPYVPNGEGLATEFRIGNLTNENIHGYLEFRLPEGALDSGVILR